jgi:hypothetical protein
VCVRSSLPDVLWTQQDLVPPKLLDLDSYAIASDDLHGQQQYQRHSTVGQDIVACMCSLACTGRVSLLPYRQRAVAFYSNVDRAWMACVRRWTWMLYKGLQDARLKIMQQNAALTCLNGAPATMAEHAGISGFCFFLLVVASITCTQTKPGQYCSRP